MKITMKLERTTPGALLYKEVDAHGRQLTQQEAAIGSFYMRKSSELGKVAPITITVEVTDAAR